MNTTSHENDSSSRAPMEKFTVDFKILFCFPRALFVVCSWMCAGCGPIYERRVPHALQQRTSPPHFHHQRKGENPILFYLFPPYGGLQIARRCMYKVEICRSYFFPSLFCLFFVFCIVFSSTGLRRDSEQAGIGTVLNVQTTHTRVCIWNSKFVFLNVNIHYTWCCLCPPPTRFFFRSCVYRSIPSRATSTS